MTWIIGSRMPRKTLVDAGGWSKVERPCGMARIMWMDTRYPSRREADSIKARLGEDEVCIVFNANDRPVAVYSP